MVTGRLTGDFPGGTADLRWDFTVAGDRVTRLGDCAMSRAPRTSAFGPARAAPRGLAPDEGHAAPVLPDPRQDPARHHGAAQPLVERAALRRRPRADDPAAAPRRHDVRAHDSTSSMTPWRSRRPTVAPLARAGRRRARGRLRCARSTRLLAELGIDVEIREEPFGVPMTTPFPQDLEHAVVGSRRRRRLRPRPRLVGLACSRSSAAGSTARRARCTCSGTASTSPSPASPAGPAPPLDADAVTREAYSQELISFGFWAGRRHARRRRLLLLHRAGARGAARRSRCRWARGSRPAPGSSAILPYETVRTARDPRATLLAFCQGAYEAGARLAGWDTTRLHVRVVPEPGAARRSADNRGRRLRPSDRALSAAGAGSPRRPRPRSLRRRRGQCRREPELGDRDLAHPELLDLAGDRHREGVDELPVARDLVASRSGRGRRRRARRAVSVRAVARA